MKKDFTNQMLDLIEANQDIEPNQLFGEMIQLATMGLYDMAPNYPTAQAVIHAGLQNGLDSHINRVNAESEDKH